MNIRDAFVICNPLATPNFPAAPCGETEAELRERFLEKRRPEVEENPVEYANALELYLYQKPTEFAETVKRACSCSLGCSVALKEMVKKAIDTYLDVEWAERDEVEF